MLRTEHAWTGIGVNVLGCWSWRRHLCLPRQDSELLISWNLGRPKFVHQPQIRPRENRFRGGEFLAQVAHRMIVGRLRQVV